MKLVKIDTTGKKTSITASDKVFAAKPNKNLLAQAVRVYLANQHPGLSVVKTRSDVKRTTKKWFKQKGTGNARHGARSANIFVGGGVAHGPQLNPNLTLNLNKSQKANALISALSLQAENIVINDELATLSGKTKQADELLNKSIKSYKKLLIISDIKDEKLIRATKNLAEVRVVAVNKINALDVLNCQNLLMSKETLKKLEERIETK